jgi:hypothetical protein
MWKGRWKRLLRLKRFEAQKHTLLGWSPCKKQAVDACGKSAEASLPLGFLVLLQLGRWLEHR